LRERQQEHHADVANTNSDADSDAHTHAYADAGRAGICLHQPDVVSRHGNTGGHRHPCRGGVFRHNGLTIEQQYSRCDRARDRDDTGWAGERHLPGDDLPGRDRNHGDDYRDTQRSVENGDDDS
jgi:hypothetical protein